MKFILTLAQLVLLASSERQIRLNKDNKLKVIQITDIHYGEDEKKDAATTEEMKKLIDWETPDMAILTGDMVSGYAWDGKEQGWYEKQWDKWTQAFIDKALPYMYVQGNHDSQADIGRDAVASLDMTLNISMTEKGPSSVHGTSNYVYPVYDQEGQNKLFYLWAFDSMSDNCEGVDGWGCVYPDTVEWYRAKSEELIKSDNGTLPGYAFFHIPLPEYLDMTNAMQIHGTKKEDVCCFSVNTGLYAAMKEMGNMKATFCGHDHNNDYFGEYYGMELHFGRKTGHGGYGPARGLQRGAKILEFTYDNDQVKLDTWIRQEDGSKMVQSKKIESFWDTIHDYFLKSDQKQCCGMHADEVVFLKEFRARKFGQIDDSADDKDAKFIQN